MTAIWSRCEVCNIRILDTGENAKAHERCSDHEVKDPGMSYANAVTEEAYRKQDSDICRQMLLGEES
jgi:hypothetical protein